MNRKQVLGVNRIIFKTFVAYLNQNSNIVFHSAVPQCGLKRIGVTSVSYIMTYGLLMLSHAMTTNLAEGHSLWLIVQTLSLLALSALNGANDMIVNRYR